MKRFAVFIVSAGVAVAQQRPVQAPAQTPFHEAATILAKADPQPPAKKGKAALAPAKQPDFTGAIIAHREPPVLPDSAKVGLSLADTMAKQGLPPVASPDGRLLWIYGHSNPVVVCSILQACVVELERGEKLGNDGNVDVGDNRFQVTQRTAGSGPDEYPYVVVKPTEPGLKTSLIVGTNRRAYRMDLLSTDKAMMPRVAFSYPDDEARKDQELRDKVRAREEAERIEAEKAAKLAKADTTRPAKHWNYTLSFHGKDAQYLRPLSITDDGIHTRIILTPEAQYRGLPVVEISDARGTIPQNRRWEGSDTLVIDAVFKHGCLMSGSGRKQQRVCINNEDMQ